MTSTWNLKWMSYTVELDISLHGEVVDSLAEGEGGASKGSKETFQVGVGSGEKHLRSVSTISQGEAALQVSCHIGGQQ